MTARLLPLSLLLVVAGCSFDAADSANDMGPLTENVNSDFESMLEVGDEFALAAELYGVPETILLAIAYEESRWEFVEGEVEFEGTEPAFGLMALRGERLSRAAALAGLPEDEVAAEREANIRAAAALLADEAERQDIDIDDLSAWGPVVAWYSGVDEADAQADYVHNGVFRRINEGVQTEFAQIRPTEVLADFALPRLQTSTAERAGVIWRSSPNHSARPSGAAGTPSMIIIHTCEGSYSGCWSWLANSSSGVSAHYVVNSDGSEVTQLVSEARKAWHIGSTYDCDLNSQVDCSRDGSSNNNFTIGIEHAGYGSQASWDSRLISRSAALVCEIATARSIPKDRYHIVGHGQLQPYNRSDPGPNWPWTTYLTQAAACGGGSSGSGSSGSGSSSSGGSSSGGSSSGGSSSGSGSSSSGSGSSSSSPVEIVIDSNSALNGSNARIEVSSYWGASNNVGGYYNTGYWWRSTAEASDSAHFWFYLGSSTRLTVEGWWPAAGDRSRSAPFMMYDASERHLGTFYVDQSGNHSRWVALGTYDFTAGWNRVSLSRWTTPGYVVIADAVRVRTP
ncbi:MAG: N-acetylmuramoyl-L-alanine amidase [Deltaproteobacteria bacterium]|nr:N-acetylmuramoyl-L-alanine amidase [Deltaproteobacteria bacterium]